MKEANKHSEGPWSLIRSLFICIIQVAFFWQLRLYQWWTRPTRKQLLLDNLSRSQLFEEWLSAAYLLDDLEENNVWRQTFASKHYDYRLISDRLQCLIEAVEDEDLPEIISLMRSGLIRNLGNITAPRLFSRAYAGTKLLIEDYISQLALAIEMVTEWPTSVTQEPSFSSQDKLDTLHDTRQAFGRTVLVLQGGSIFGLCHIGVVKALHLRGLLPRIISGTATGALIAALVGTHHEDQLVSVLSGDGIDLSAFTARSKEAAQHTKNKPFKHGLITTLVRRIRRFLDEGYLLDHRALDECVRANIGDITFSEAYHKSKRILNITINPSSSGLPSLLNYLTAPNVLVWSAALASNHPSDANSPPQLFCKDEDGKVSPWSGPHNSDFDASSKTKYASERESPMNRIAELFNVNHFIVSQARPYIAPFLQSDLSSPKPGYAGRKSLSTIFLKVLYMEIQHRLHQLDSLGYLSSSSRRFLMDENVPGPSLTIVPEVSLADFSRLLENPTRESLDYWILKGEKSVWPAVGALKIRMVVEVELDRGYQFVRRRKPLDVAAPNSNFTLAEAPPELRLKKKRKRNRAASTGADA
ncbi:patatin-like serine hydrolase [Myriangium duriaei CBS 260.36]|uniref:Patatin-like serine hydrolase n=1 Tax=Myriangium duriaei CBS 260.36 TaxID=1168546 RepID=A0A9P4JCP5_9PEZI|nr:patatin-like serine hydrolase [Myriangium duriaei CBS 260.36]